MHEQQITHEHQPIIVSRKGFRRIMMPTVGDIVEEKFRVLYINEGKLRFTATANELPPVGTGLHWDGKIYTVDYVMSAKKRFTAVFRGFATAQLPDAPEEEQSDVVKLID